MAELEDHIKRIHEKMQHLLKKHALLQRDNKKLLLEQESMRSTLTEKQTYIALLEQRIEVLKASKGNLTPEEKKLFEKRINTYIKEIDKCISSLNE